MKVPTFATNKERRAHGESLRKVLHRVNQAKWRPASKSRDSLGAVLASNVGRLPELIPVRMGRMSISPFAFFRGTAALMAADLAGHPVTGLRAQLCGDAHVRNLGAYAAPDGHLAFDLNDFDETSPGPWEWDLKRLATSVVLCGREAGDSDGACRAAVTKLVKSYRESMDFLSRMKVIDLVQYQVSRFRERGVIAEVLDKAERVTPLKTLQKLTETAKGGHPQFRNDPPALQRVNAATQKKVLQSLGRYRETVGAGRQIVLDAYRPADVAFKVVGTGSVGTRDYVVLLFGNGLDDPMFLQVKEARPSAIARVWKKDVPPVKHQGQRVAQGQQRMQTVTDPFLGWTTIDGRDFLVRQLADRKAAIDPLDLKGKTMLEYVGVCGETLAKAHARTGDSVEIAGYCGDNAKLDKAIAQFATAYADQTTKDYQVFMKAIKAGKIKAVEGV